MKPESPFTADSKTGEEQSLRKVDETLIVDFNFLTVLLATVSVVVYENQHSKFHIPEHFEKDHQFWNR